ncbi:MAG TPA: hypothetical protein VJZ76_12745 [Thermoanaerobaculia bacterium]|nr:hypothetical protein [Thermoanaerobaculia bacterium]
MNARLATAPFLILAAVLAMNADGQTSAQNENPYAAMAPVDQYLMNRDAEIALARSAAPESISRDAKVLVLGRHGYETASEGKNGFVCAVERSWMAPFDNREFWNPKIRGAICYNPAAARSVLPITLVRTEMALGGVSIADMPGRLKAAYARKPLPALEPAAMSFMMSKGAYLTDDGHHNVPHVMFYTPIIDGANWGADVPNSPIYLLPHGGAPEPVNIFIITARSWSDGTPVAAPHIGH